MKILTKAIASLMLVLIYNDSLAGPGTGEFTIQEVRVESGNVYLYPSTEISNALGCDAATPIKLEPADLGFQEMYSMSLAALASEKHIKCWLKACTSSPWGRTIPKVYACGMVAK